MKTFKVVVTYKGVFVRTSDGMVINGKYGDVIDGVSDSDAKILVGLGRARLFDPILDAPPPPAPEPEPIVEEIIEKPTPRTGRGSRKTQED